MCAGQQALTRDEAKHVGQTFVHPPVYKEFQASVFSNHASLLVNDFDKHHELIYNFCRNRSQKYCTWSEYYHVLDFIRVPYENLFDPKPSTIESLKDIQIRGDAGSNGKQMKCDVISKPTAEILFDYVSKSKPV